MQKTNKILTDAWPASEVPEAEGLAVAEVLVLAVATDAELDEALATLCDAADEVEDATELAEEREEDIDFAAAFFPPEWA